jgi:hypothetical protein
MTRMRGLRNRKRGGLLGGQVEIGSKELYPLLPVPNAHSGPRKADSRLRRPSPGEPR